MKKAIAEILLNEGWVKDVKIVEDGYNGKIAITLKYVDKKSVISGLQRVSRPGLRNYADVENMPRILGGFGTVILSTNKGVMTGKNAKANNVGGEVLCYVW
jgi:small subunit ribosomal protein S8